MIGTGPDTWQIAAVLLALAFAPTVCAVVYLRRRRVDALTDLQRSALERAVHDAHFGGLYD